MIRRFLFNLGAALFVGPWVAGMFGPDEIAPLEVVYMLAVSGVGVVVMGLSELFGKVKRKKQRPLQATNKEKAPD